MNFVQLNSVWKIQSDPLNISSLCPQTLFFRLNFPIYEVAWIDNEGSLKKEGNFQN